MIKLTCVFLLPTLYNPGVVGGQNVTVLFCYREDFVQLEGVLLLAFDSEKQMLLAWKEFFLRFDPDVLTGFDSVENMALILDRAEQ